jgi:hypothetical protein
MRRAGLFPQFPPRDSKVNLFCISGVSYRKRSVRRRIVRTTEGQQRTVPVVSQEPDGSESVALLRESGAWLSTMAVVVLRMDRGERRRERGD